MRDFTFIADYQNPISGASRIECGNYRGHDLGQCRQYAQKMCGMPVSYTHLDVYKRQRLLYLPLMLLNTDRHLQRSRSRNW